MKDLGISTDTGASARTQELKYWRKMASLEEEAAIKQAGMMLSMLSSFLESFTNAVGFTTIRTQGLSDAIQDALEAGDFDLAIKRYCVSPHALTMLKNPITSFMTSFGHVVLRTHVENVKRELRDGINGLPKAPPPVVPSPIPDAPIRDPSGTVRPRFAPAPNTTPDMSASFRNHMTAITPAINAMVNMSAS